jgi:hypothetical protein
MYVQKDKSNSTDLSNDMQAHKINHNGTASYRPSMIIWHGVDIAY